MPRRIQLMTLKRTAEMMVGPPGEPVTKLSWPSRRRIVGVMELRGGVHIHDDLRGGGPRGDLIPRPRPEGLKPVLHEGLVDDGVGVRLDQAEQGVGDAGLCGEIVHFVVEQKSGGAGGVRTEAVVERVGAGDGVGGGVDHGKVRGVRAFAKADDGVRGVCVAS